MADASDTWVALDFETATSERHSACSLAVVVVENGEVTKKADWLIRPPENSYDYHNTQVHGIKPSDTAGAYSYDALYPEIEPYLRDHLVVAHWAQFDLSVIRALHRFYRIPLPDTRYACSCMMARAAFPSLYNHQLPTVCDHCGIPLQHHDAASDALACAHVALHCTDSIGARSIDDALASLRVNIKTL